MNIIITMAGEGKRFKEFGFNCPKHEIVIGNKSLFEWSINSLKDLFDEKFYFIVRKGFYENKNLINLIKYVGIKNYKIIEIKEITEGQALTAFYANSYINPNESVLIYNIDTYVEEGQINISDFEDVDGLLHVFKAPGEKWSFAKVNDKNEVIEVSEKIRISDLASIGLYYFDKWFMFTEVLKKFKESIKNTYNEVYIAPMYQHLLTEWKIKVFEIEYDKVHILGTPEDLEKFSHEYLKGGEV